jgi:hypothetical protein
MGCCFEIITDARFAVYVDMIINDQKEMESTSNRSDWDTGSNRSCPVAAIVV